MEPSLTKEPMRLRKYLWSHVPKQSKTNFTHILRLLTPFPRAINSMCQLGTVLLKNILTFDDYLSLPSPISAMIPLSLFIIASAILVIPYKNSHCRTERGKPYHSYHAHRAHIIMTKRHPCHKIFIAHMCDNRNEKLKTFIANRMFQIFSTLPVVVKQFNLYDRKSYFVKINVTKTSETFTLWKLLYMYKINRLAKGDLLLHIFSRKEKQLT